MLERRRIPHNPIEDIDIVDKALVEGDLDLAESVLLDALKTTYTKQPDIYHHLALKAAAMPLYELVEANSTAEERENAAQVAYGWVANFIESELSSPDYYSSEREVQKRRRGRLSEDVAFSFLIRKFLRTDRRVPFPATHFEDKIHKIDFILVPLTGLDETGKNIQVKTRSPQHIVDGAIYISMNLLDPEFNTHDMEGSLARCLVREAAGIADPEEIEKLKCADRRLDALLA